MKRMGKALLFFAALGFLWELLVRTRLWSPVLVPSPLSVAGYLWGGGRRRYARRRHCRHN